jgi:hypothetical protein
VKAIKLQGKKAGIFTNKKWWEANIEDDCKGLET